MSDQHAYSERGVNPMLSPREIEVLEMTARGLTNSQMGEHMNVSIHAIKFHLASIYRKLQVSNRTEAVVVYLRGQSDRPRLPEAN